MDGTGYHRDGSIGIYCIKPTDLYPLKHQENRD